MSSKQAKRPAAITSADARSAGIAPLTSFVGRARELAIIGAALADPSARLLTLTGPGGVGKTRLAVRAAELAADRFPGGVVVVELAALVDPALVLPVVGRGLGVPESSAPPLAAR